MAKPQVLNIDLISLEGTQNRQASCQETVNAYAEIWTTSNGEVPFPPIDVFHDGSDYFCADGFHRILGAVAAKRASIPCVIHKGTARDAFLFGCSANLKHGLRRSNADKRFAVVKLLKDPEWGKLSQAKLADLAHVTRQFVAQVKVDIAPPALGSNDNTSVKVANKNRGKNSNASTTVDASTDSAAGSGGGVVVTPPMTPAAGDVPEISFGNIADPCPNCGCTKWDEDAEGYWACSKCSHPWGEPAGDKDPAVPPPSIVKDELERDVIDDMREQHGLAAALKAMGNSLDKTRREVKEMAELPGGRWLEAQHIDDLLNQAKRAIQKAAYYTECPTCKRKVKPACKRCEGAGFIPVRAKGVLSDAEKAWLAK